MPDPMPTAGPTLRLAHVALWTRDLERMSRFYAEVLGAEIGPRYVNPRTGLASRFARFEGASVELMTRPDVAERGAGGTATGAKDGTSASPAGANAVVSVPAEGYAHLALALGSREGVDGLVTRLGGRGVPIVGAPRQTGDGYYEAVIADPDGNLVEIVAE